MLSSVPRYLVPFHPKRMPHYFADVLIIGGGLAGLRAANAVDHSLQVLVVTKDRLLQSNSNYAQGGIAGVLGLSPVVRGLSRREGRAAALAARRYRDAAFTRRV